jgi:hypothetical protein
MSGSVAIDQGAAQPAAHLDLPPLAVALLKSLVRR